MKKKSPSAFALCCFACFMLGYLLGEEHQKNEVRKALENLRHSFQAIPDTRYEEESVPSHPAVSYDPAQMREILLRKDRELKRHEEKPKPRTPAPR